MPPRYRTPWLLPVIGGTLAAGPFCASSEPDEPEAPCTPNQFESCELPCGRGVRQCRETDAGIEWSDCMCLLLDGGYAEAGPNGGEAGDSGAAGAASSAGTAGGAGEAAPAGTGQGARSG